VKKEESLEVSAYIGGIIASKAPRVSYTSEELARARESYSEEKLEELSREGYYHGDFERFYAMLCFAEGMDLWQRADEAYLKKLFSSARKMDRAEFLKDPYLSQVRVPHRARGKILLTEATYERGEFFQYDMPSLREEIVVPKIGFFTERVSFPAIYEGTMPWVSVCPSEIHSMAPDLEAARGRVLVLGLGLGYYPFRISAFPEVKEIVIVEKNSDILHLFRKEILPQFPQREKITLVQADAFRYLEECPVGRFDFCYADIWEGWEDGARCCERIFPQELRLKGTRFRYWIYDEILWYLENA